MIRALGAALVMLGAAALGVRAYLSLGAEVRSLAGFRSMLSILRCEISQNFATLESALETARSVEPSRAFVDRVLGGIARRGGAETGDCWREASSALPTPLRDILAELAPVLGRYSAAEQGAAIAATEQKLAALLERAEERRRSSGKMYITFGVCGGVAAAVLFL